MFINIVVEPEVGGIASCHGKIRAINGYPHLEVITGKVETVLPNSIKMEDSSYNFPIHRVSWFTFGGIETRNSKYDAKRVAEENDIMLSKLVKEGKLV